MGLSEIVLHGDNVRLEPLSHRHLDGLVSAAAADPSLYQWTVAPQDEAAMGSYIDTALAWKQAGTAAPFAIIRLTDDTVIGSTRFWNIEHWTWPPGHPRYNRGIPDVCEIGYTWYTRSAIRTAANSEAKLLMLTHAFEVWQVLRVSFHTDLRNRRSRAALERIGAKREGVLRAHRLAVDVTPRDSARYSIVAAEWPEAKEHLLRLARA